MAHGGGCFYAAHPPKPILRLSCSRRIPYKYAWGFRAGVEPALTSRYVGTPLVPLGYRKHKQVVHPPLKTGSDLRHQRQGSNLHRRFWRARACHWRHWYAPPPKRWRGLRCDGGEETAEAAVLPKEVSRATRLQGQGKAAIFARPGRRSPVGREAAGHILCTTTYTSSIPQNGWFFSAFRESCWKLVLIT